MKISSKIAVTALGLVFIGSAVSAQSLDDAKQAINAEQYQKAKTMLKNLTVTEANKDENYFYLGWVYLKQDEPDSAKYWFNRGIAIDGKTSLNYVGLGAVAHLDKDQGGITSNFDQAIANTSKRDDKTYVYIGKSYLLTPSGGSIAPNSVSPADAKAAIDALTKAITINPKDPDAFIARGDAELTQLNSNDAYTDYQAAISIDPKSALANVQLGVIVKYSNNFEDAIKDYQAAIAIDQNFGPAYREWAETDARWAQVDPKVALDKDNEAIEEYKKYLSLTDMSLQSQMRYADFLITAGKYQELEQVAKQLASYANSNLRVYRYLGYASYENKDYPAGLTAMNTWMTKADPKRIIPKDYLYLGHLQIASGQDSIGMLSLKKAYELDTTQVEALGEIAAELYHEQKYKEAGDEYTLYVTKNPDARLPDLFKEGEAYYFAFQNQYYSKAVPKPTPDTTLLTKADTAFSKVQQKATRPVATIALFRARLYDLKEPDRNNIKGLAKPFYDEFIKEALAAGAPTDDRTKTNLAEAYDYLGAYYELKEKDDTQALANYTQALVYEPTDAQALDYMKRKGKK